MATIALHRQSKLREAALAKSARLTLEQLHAQLAAGDVKELPLIIKADVQGSLEAVTESLRRLEREDVRVAFVQRGVGGITENDVQLAVASNATIIGFNVRPDRRARELAEAQNVEIRTYEIIYKLVEDIEAAMVGMDGVVGASAALDGKMSLRNFAVCPATASVVVTGGIPLTGAPVRSVTSNVTLTDAVEVLATAMPLSIFPGRPGTPEAST